MIGDYNCTVDLLTALDWQRSKAEVVKKFIFNEQKWLEDNHCKFWNDWVRDVFTLSTANDFGLSVWSIILDEPIFGFSGASPQDYPSWGFGPSDENFFDGSFATDSDYSYQFTTEQKRSLLQLKAFNVLSMGGTINQINVAMKNIFGEGVIIAFDTLKMKFTYNIHDRKLANFIREIANRDLLPRPIGIGVEYTIL